MKGFLIFSAGALTGSLLTYFCLKKKYSPEEVVVEYPEEIVVAEKEEKKEEEVVRVNYQDLVKDLYSKKPTSNIIEAPYIITEEAYHESYYNHDKRLLTYYELDGTLADDDYIVEDIDYEIGLNNLYLLNDDPIYVRNEHTGCDYKITPVNAAYDYDIPSFEDEE